MSIESDAVAIMSAVHFQNRGLARRLITDPPNTDDLCYWFALNWTEWLELETTDP